MSVQGDDEDYEEYEEDIEEEYEDDVSSESSDDSDDLDLEDNEEFEQHYEEEYIHPKISKYEISKILGLRSQEIAEGGPIYEGTNMEYINPIDIALDDFNNNNMTFMLGRFYPDKKKKVEKNIKFDSLFRCKIVR